MQQLLASFPFQM